MMYLRGAMLSDQQGACSYTSADLLRLSVKPWGDRDARGGGGIFQKMGKDSGAHLVAAHVMTFKCCVLCIFKQQNR